MPVATSHPAVKNDLGAATFVTPVGLDGHKNETGPGWRTTPNSVVLALHFSVGGGRDFPRKAKTGMDGVLHLSQARSLSSMSATISEALS
jgi:hypothetical protein